MGRKLGCVLLVATLGVSSTASALGLGPIDPATSLNEPLSARIPLFAVAPGEADRVKAELASPAAFERAGVQLLFHLTELDFEVVTEAGQPYIHVTTTDPVKEPFLDFLVVVSWPQGRMVREYTVLLNPPLYNPGMADGGLLAGGGGAEAEGVGEPGAPAAVTAAAPPSTMVDPVADDFGGLPTPQTYGPVQANETLWGIANRIRPGGAAEINQTMLAILRANPDAFINSNINALKRGAVLRIPDQQTIAAISPEEATAAVRQQFERWQANRTEATGGAPADGESAPGNDQSLASASATEGVEEAAEVDGQLSVVAPANSTGSDATTSLTSDDLAPTEQNIERLQSEVVSLEEHSASLESANSELRAQVESLKQELAALRSALNLQMEQTLPAVAEEPAATALVEPVGQDDPVAAGDDAATGTSAGPIEAPESQFPEPVIEQEPQASAAPVSEPLAAQESPVESEPADQSRAGPAADAVTPEPQPTFLESLLGNTRALAIAGGSALLVLLLLLAVLRRRRGGNEPDDAPDAEATAVVAGGAALASAGGQSGGDEAAAETAASGGKDALEQADVYLAYGRYDQAQEVLDRALGEEPDNRELRARLLEVLAKQGDRGGFEAEAQVLHTQLDDESDPLWQKTVALGKEIAPEHPLFSAEEHGVGGPAESAPAPVTGQVGPVQPVREDDDAATAFALTPEESSRADLNDADIAMGADAGLDSERDGGGLDFELPAAPPPAAEPFAASGSQDADDAGADFDLDFSIDEDGADEAGATVAEDFADLGDDGEDADELGALEFEIPASDISPEPLPDKRLASDPGAADLALDDGDDEIDDEVGTKLDLARAYLDMGDSDGARDLLGEVVEEGSDDQKTEARRLLSNVG